MTDSYLATAVREWLDAQHARGMLVGRPTRIDGLGLDEIGPVISTLKLPGTDPRVRALGEMNREADPRPTVNAERATHYRNRHASVHELGPFILFVPLGMVVESSLDEPAFVVVPRSAIFREALGSLRSEMAVSVTDIEAIRASARFRQDESVFAFLFDIARYGRLDPKASRLRLGLLEDTLLPSLVGDLGQVRERLRRHADVLDVILKPGQAPARVLEELGRVAGLDVDACGEDVGALVSWWQGGQRGDPPPAIDYATWRFGRSAAPPVLIFEPDLLQPPHRGWMNAHGVTKVTDMQQPAQLAWRVEGGPPKGVKVALDLIEESSQGLVRSLGATGAKTKKIDWGKALGKDAREILKELAPTAELDGGYTLRIRARLLNGQVEEAVVDSEPFLIDDITTATRDAPEEAARAGWAAQALYQFHVQAKASAPTIADRTSDTDPGAVRFVTANGRIRVTALDVSEPLVDLERRLLAEPMRLGPWRARPSDGDAIGELELTANDGLAMLQSAGWAEFAKLRREFFDLVAREGCAVEALDLEQRLVRQEAEHYLRAYAGLAAAMTAALNPAGGVSLHQRRQAVALAGVDAVEFPVAAAQAGLTVLLVPPFAPASLAWLLESSALLSEWSSGTYDADRKPPYDGWVEGLAVGPRVMAMETLRGDDGTQGWVFAGNLTPTWAVYLPAGTSAEKAAGWGDSLAERLQLTPRRLGAGRSNASKVGSRLRQFAVTHPYVDQMQIAAVGDGDGKELVDALTAIDEVKYVPSGVRSIRNVRFEVTLMGPATGRLGRAIDDFTMNPGDARWRRHADAILDNPESVLVPGFSYAVRALDPSAGYWSSVAHELAAKTDGYHVTIVGPALDANVDLIPTDPRDRALQARGLVARPVTRQAANPSHDPFHGTWSIAVSDATAIGGSLASRLAHALGRFVAIGRGSADPATVPAIQVGIAGGRATAYQAAIENSDWLVITDPLFSVEIVDVPPGSDAGAILLDFTPEFDPYPGGRVIVATRSLREIEEFADRFGGSLNTARAFIPVLASISARRLLALANPTQQVVHELTGLALTRAFIAAGRPGSLVVPVDMHQDMFAIKADDSRNLRADLLVVDLGADSIRVTAVESKMSRSANFDAMVADGGQQALATRVMLQKEYIDYTGVDREVRIENLREVLLFHHARAVRHGVVPDFTRDDVVRFFDRPGALEGARIDSMVVGWHDVEYAVDSEETTQDGTHVLRFGSASVRAYSDRLGEWPRIPVVVVPPASAVGGGGESAPPAPEPPTGQSAETGTGGVSPGAPSEPEIAPATGGHPPVPTGVHPVSECVTLGIFTANGAAADWCPPDAVNGHLALIGGSGAGKTTTLRIITDGIRRAGIPVLVLDFHGDITPVGEGEVTHAFDYEGNQSYVNPFHLDPRYAKDLSPNRLKREFMEAWRTYYSTMGIQQAEYLQSLIEDAYRGAGIGLDPATWRGHVDFGSVLAAFEASQAPEPVKQKIRAYMRQFEEWQVFHGGTPIAVESFLQASTRLDLSRLDEAARNIVADVVLRRLFLLVRALQPLPDTARGWEKFRVFVVIDEAQLLMGSTSEAKASLTRYAAEARKFGIGLILATQLRDNVPPEIWGNIDTRIFMQALDPNERSRNAKAAGIQEAQLGALKRGQGYFIQASRADIRPRQISFVARWLAGRSSLDG